MYFEDVDLSWRAQLRGWRFAFVPDAIGTHSRGGSGGKASTAILACNHRNRLLLMLHNDSPASFLRHSPGIAYTELRASMHMLLLRPAALLLAWFQFLKLLPRHYRIRRLIQQRRRVGWRDLEHVVRAVPVRDPPRHAARVPRRERCGESDESGLFMATPPRTTSGAASACTRSA